MKERGRKIVAIMVRTFITAFIFVEITLRYVLNIVFIVISRLSIELKIGSILCVAISRAPLLLMKAMFCPIIYSRIVS